MTATMPEGAFYGQEGAALRARQVRFRVKKRPCPQVRFRVKKGSYERVHDWVRFRRDVEDNQIKNSTLTAIPKVPHQPAFELEQFRSFAVRQLVWLLLLPLPELNKDDQKVLAALSNRISGVSQARVLALEFRRLLLEKDVKALESWFSTVKSSGLPEPR